MRRGAVPRGLRIVTLPSGDIARAPQLRHIVLLRMRRHPWLKILVLSRIFSPVSVRVEKIAVPLWLVEYLRRTGGTNPR